LFFFEIVDGKITQTVVQEIRKELHLKKNDVREGSVVYNEEKNLVDWFHIGSIFQQ